jgi:putative chitinase
MAILKDIKESYKEKLRNSFESNTGVLGQAMQDRREKEAKDQRIQNRVQKIEGTTQSIRLSGSTLTHIEVLFTQISKNFELINKEFGVAVTTQEETNKALAATKVEAKQPITATKLSFGAPKAEGIDDLKIEEAGGPSIMDMLLDVLDAGMEAAKKKLAQAAEKRAARKAAEKAAKKAAKEAAKKAAKKAGAKALKDAVKKGLEGKAKQQFIKAAEKAAAKKVQQQAAAQMAQIAEKQAARAVKKAALEEAQRIAIKAGEKKAVEAAAKAAIEAAAKKTAKKVATDVIKKVAIKAIAKNLAKAGVKSIPLLGAAIGVGFAAVKLFQGDYVGAGVEAASGVGSAITAIPAAIYSTIREVYKELYGEWPEGDPLVNDRMPELKKIVTDAASDFLGKKVEPAVPPTPVKAPPPAVVPPPLPPPPPPHTCTCPPVAATAAPPPPPPTAPAAVVTQKAPAPTPAAAPPTPVAGAAVAATTPTPKPKTASGGEELMLQTLKAENLEPNAIAAIMAQASHESGGFKTLEENLSYGASALKSLFGKYFQDVDPKEYERKPEKIANRIYGSRMGNGPEASGDGWKYRGRGFIQMTGKQNYADAGKSIGVDLIGNPDLAADPKIAAQIVVWFFKKNIKRITDWANVEQITKVVNGGLIGLEDRKKEFKHFLDKMASGTMVAAVPSTGTAIAQQSTQVAGVKTEMKQQQNNVQIVKINETNRKTVTV